VKQKDEKIENLKAQLAQATDFKMHLRTLIELSDALVKTRNDYLTKGYLDNVISWASGSAQIKLSDDVAVYVDDYFGGRVIKQEATSVTILDKKGKATYGLTARKADKGKDYILHFGDGASQP